MNDILNIKIGDLGITITGKTPSSKSPEDFGTDYMFITPSDSFEQKYISTTERYLSEQGVKKLKSKLLPPHSLMVTCIGSAMGKVAMNRTECITNQQINSIIPSKNLCPDYLYYVLKNSYLLLRNAATGSTALPLLNKTDFDNLEMTIHKNKNTQQQIASVLSSLDSKIELNNCINAELEAMAKTIYDYWFVQFDFPDKKGKPYKTSGGKMVWNDALKREIPEGWEVKSMATFCTKIGDGIHGTPLYVESSEYSFINGNNIKNGFIQIDSETKKVSQEECRKYFIELNERTILLSINGTIGNLAMYDDEKIMLGKSAAFLNCKEKNMPYCYYYLTLKHIQKKMWNIATGSTIKNLSLDSINNLPLLFPGDDLIKAFYNITEPVFNKRKKLFKENQQFTELRDWLLPMLMNGQVKVKEAEEMLSMAAEGGVEYKKK